MHYAIFAITALLASSGSAELMPAAYGYAPSVNPFQPTPSPSPSSTPSPTPMAGSASASASYNAMLYQHYYMTPKAKPSSSVWGYHKSFSVSASYSMAYSMSASASASVSAMPSHPLINSQKSNGVGHIANNAHGMQKPHPKEGFPVPAGIESIPGVKSFNGASSKPGGYTGGNGNEENISHDGSPVEGYEEAAPPSMPVGAFDPASPSTPSSAPVHGSEQAAPPSMPSGAFNPASPSTPSSAPRSSDEDADDIMGSNIPSGGIAPVDSMAPGEIVAPVNGEKQTHGADLGNSFCLGTCYASKEEAKCQAPYTSPLYQAGQGCWSCCFTSPDF